MRSTVIIVTLNRPDCVRQCLECLAKQEPGADQTIIVDASPDDRTRHVVEEYEGVLYLRNDNGYGRMTQSRNIGLRHATGDIIAFLDDDAFPHRGWLEDLLATYTDPTIGAVGGRALNNEPDEALLGVQEIGRLKDDGTLTGYFAADPGRVIEVDHIMGCNMSFRRKVIAELGGFCEDYPGISGVREDTDMCLRVKRLGYRLMFNPLACADHIGAPQAQGKRFDARYEFYSTRNHCVLLIRNFGLQSAILRRFLVWLLKHTTVEFTRRIGAAVVRTLAAMYGSSTGILSGITLVSRLGKDPVRRDPEAEQLRQALQSHNQIVAKEPVVI